MLSEWIDGAVEALEEIGIQAGRGYPGTKIPLVYSPVVTVSLEEYTEHTLTLAADVFVAAEQGGSECEETAMKVAGVLTEKMAVCSVGACKYSGQTGLFTVRVLARWYRELDYAVKIDDVAIAYVTSCCAEKATVRLPYVDATTGETLVTVSGSEWNITVTDIWPLNEKMQPETAETFTLFVMRPGGLEAYPGCMWTQITLEETPAGVLRTRVAKTTQDRVIGAG